MRAIYRHKTWGEEKGGFSNSSNYVINIPTKTIDMRLAQLIDLQAKVTRPSEILGKPVNNL